MPEDIEKETILSEDTEDVLEDIEENLSPKENDLL